MATISQENIGLQHEKITIQIDKEDYQSAVQKTLKKLSKEANIPGFRKGMVPMGHINKLYGQSVFADEVLKAAGTKLEEYLVETKAEIFARPIPAETQIQYEFNAAEPGNYTFEFEIGTRPHFDIPLLSNNTTIPLYKVKVTEEMINEEVEKLQLKAGEMSDADSITSDDNVVHLLIKETNEQGETVQGGIDTKHSLLLKYFSPAVKAQFLGHKIGDTATAHINEVFGDEFKESILKDLGIAEHAENNVVLTIEKIETIEKAEIGPAMFEKIYPGRGIETEEAFRETLRNEIQQYWNSHAKTHLQNDLFERLVHETPINIPTAFLKRWMSVGGEKYTPMEVVEQEFGKFEHQLRWQLISDKIIEENKLEVSKDEMEQAARMQVMSYFGQYGSMPDMDVSWMEPVVKKQLADRKFSDELYNRIITDKLFYVVENQVNLQESDITKDEFMALVSKPHHHHH